jgi:hypothetical protein
MRRRLRRYRLWLACLAIITLAITALPGGSTPQAMAQAADPPQSLISDRIVSDWTVGGPRLLWLSYPDCFTSLGVYDPVTIRRISTSGGLERAIFSSNEARPAGTCNPYKLNSNIVADDQFIYWVEGTRLVRLAVTANPGDAPQPWGPTFGSQQPVATSWPCRARAASSACSAPASR